MHTYQSLVNETLETDDQGAIVDADELDEVLSKPLPPEKLTPQVVAPTPAFLRR